MDPVGGAVIPRLVIAGTASGVGKTTVTVAICRALRARGLEVALFKCGPDYLDPTYHQRAAGRPAQTLDGWMMGREAVLTAFVHGARHADVALIEGVMGLFDGASPTGEEGSTAEIAKWLGAPVLLVVEAAGMARSVAAVAAGFVGFDPDVRFAGVLCNRVGSAGHLELLRKAQAAPPILGGLSTQPTLSFPERHLGLRTADEGTVSDSVFDAWGAQATEGINIDAVLAAARSAPDLPSPHLTPTAGSSNPPAPVGCRIGIAFDEAFHFYYDENLRLLQEAGAELVRFSPITGSTLPSMDGLYFGGGYPEVHAKRLTDNTGMREAVKAFARDGRPIYAECGGLMYLSAGIETVEGQLYPMVGLIPDVAVMSKRLEALGYVEVETQARTPLGPAGVRFRGHQFRYSRLVARPSDAESSGTGSTAVGLAYSVRRRRGNEVFKEGYRAHNLLASYVHAHWASNPLIPVNFVAACRESRRAR